MTKRLEEFIKLNEISENGKDVHDIVKANIEKLVLKMNIDHIEIPMGNGLVLEVGRFSSPHFNNVFSPTRINTDNGVVFLQPKMRRDASYFAQEKTLQIQVLFRSNISEAKLINDLFTRPKLALRKARYYSYQKDWCSASSSNGEIFSKALLTAESPGIIVLRS